MNRIIGFWWSVPKFIRTFSILVTILAVTPLLVIAFVKYLCIITDTEALDPVGMAVTCGIVSLVAAVFTLAILETYDAL